MRTTNHIEAYRIQRPDNPMFNSDASFGMNGIFQIPWREENVGFLTIVSDGRQDQAESNPSFPWEHVSARARSINGKGKVYEQVPNWKEMCWLKDLFWKEDEVVVQFHPAKANYVNIHPNVLHLWRWTGGEFPTPPRIAV